MLLASSASGLLLLPLPPETHSRKLLRETVDPLRLSCDLMPDDLGMREMGLAVRDAGSSSALMPRTLALRMSCGEEVARGDASAGDIMTS